MQNLPKRSLLIGLFNHLSCCVIVLYGIKRLSRASTKKTVNKHFVNNNKNNEGNINNTTNFYNKSYQICDRQQKPKKLIHANLAGLSVKTCQSHLVLNTPKQKLIVYLYSTLDLILFVFCYYYFVAVRFCFSFFIFYHIELVKSCHKVTSRNGLWVNARL